MHHDHIDQPNQPVSRTFERCAGRTCRLGFRRVFRRSSKPSQGRGKAADYGDMRYLLMFDSQPAPSLKGQFGPNGALYSGWESRRHNSSYDWYALGFIVQKDAWTCYRCIVRLGTTGTVIGFDVDTSHFSGPSVMKTIYV
jgi:hypothetical protein